MELILRDYRESDVDPLATLANNEKVSRYLIDTFPYPYTREDAVSWIGGGCREHGAIVKAIEADGRFVGSIGLTPQTGWRDHLAEIGYWLGEPFWGKGLGTAALNLMCGAAFGEHGFHKLFASVLAPNAPSMRILQKSGFRLAGILADEVSKHGRHYDIHHFERLARR